MKLDFFNSVIKLIATKKELIKNLHGVPEITPGFVKNIEEIFFRQMKEVTLKTR